MDKYINPFNPFIWYGHFSENDETVTSHDVSTIIHQMHTKMTNYFDTIKKSHHQTDKSINEFCEGLQYNAETIQKLIRWIDNHDKVRLVIGIKELVNLIDGIVIFYQDECGLGYWEEDDEDRMIWQIKTENLMCNVRSELMESVKALSLSFGQGDIWMTNDDEEPETNDDDQPHQDKIIPDKNLHGGNFGDVEEERKEINGRYNINPIYIHRMYLALTGRLDEEGKERNQVEDDVILKDCVSEETFTLAVVNCDYRDLYLAKDPKSFVNGRIFSYVISKIWTDDLIIRDKIIRDKYRCEWYSIGASNPDCSGRKDSDHLKKIYSHIRQRKS